MTTTRQARQALLGEWATVEWWMEKYLAAQVAPDNELYTRLLFSSFIKWARKQQLALLRPTTNERIDTDGKNKVNESSSGVEAG